MKTFILAALFALTATPAFATIQVSPHSVDFFDQPVGIGPTTQSVTIMNLGPKDVRSLGISPACGAGFSVRTYACYGPLRPYQSCQFDVSFTPYYEGYYSCTIYVNSDQGTDIVWVSGRGVKLGPVPHEQDRAPEAQPTEEQSK